MICLGAIQEKCSHKKAQNTQNETGIEAFEPFSGYGIRLTA